MNPLRQHKTIKEFNKRSRMELVIRLVCFIVGEDDPDFDIMVLMFLISKYGDITSLRGIIKSNDNTLIETLFKNKWHFLNCVTFINKFITNIKSHLELQSMYGQIKEDKVLIYSQLQFFLTLKMHDLSRLYSVIIGDVKKK